MKRVRINKGKVGLVFRNGDYIKLLEAGTHWVRYFDKVDVCNMSQPFTLNIELNILLDDKDLTNRLEVVDVMDYEIVIRYENGIFKEVLPPGRYVFWKGVIKHLFQRLDRRQTAPIDNLPTHLLSKAELSSYIRCYSIQAHEEGMLFVNGSFVQALDKGLYYFWNNSTPLSVMKVDVRQAQMEVSGQELLTKDKAALRVSVFVNYKVVDVMKAITACQDYLKQLYVAVQLALREYVGMLTLDEILERKEEVSAFVVSTVKEEVISFGVKLMSGGVRDIILPGDVRDIMNQVLVAQKKAQANIITRREETASTRSLLNTAKLMEDNKMLFKLKEMEYVEKIADKINTISLSGGSQVVDQLKQIFSPTG